MNGADLGPNVFVAMRTIAANEGWTALYRGKRDDSLMIAALHGCCDHADGHDED